MILTIIYFILILGITVFVHELGHFLFAKKFGVYVYEFSIGMGPRLFKFKRKNDETDYCIRLFPIGGFVQMAGEEVEVDTSIPEEKRLMSKPAYQRFLIMVAGVMNNFIFAFIVLFILGIFTNVSTDNIYVADSIIPNLNTGDKITAIDGRFVNNYDKLSLEIIVSGDNSYTVTAKDKSGVKKDVVVNPIPVGKSNLIYKKDYGFSINIADLSILETSRSDIKVGSKISKINDVKVENHLGLMEELNKVGDNFNLTFVDESGLENSVSITASEMEKDELVGYSYGYQVGGIEAKGILGALKFAFIKFFSTIEQMIFTVVYLITGRISLGMLSGPVGIFNAVGAYSKVGFASIVSFLCLICINVGFINLLPLPAFDGGHILFIIIEKIKGSRVNPKVENTIHNIGFILLMILMVLITYNDIINLF